MRRQFAALLFSIVVALSVGVLCDRAQAQIQSAITVTSCGAQTYSAGQPTPLTQTTGGVLCTGSGGSGGGTVVYGPVAVGSAQTQPPVMGGGTANGVGTGTTEIFTVKPASTASASTDTSLTIDANPLGNLIAAINAGSGTPGSAAPVSAVQIGGTDGTDLRAWSMNSSGQGVVVGAGTAGSASGGIVTVQGVASMTPILTSGSGTTPVIANGLSNSGVAIASGAHTLTSYYAYNPNSSACYVQIYDNTSITGTPKWSIGLPATGGANLAGLALSFTTGIEVQAATTATGSTACSSNVDANFGYR